MMKITHLPLDLKYTEVLCGRSNSDVGAMVKALYRNLTEGKAETFADGGMEVLYQLFVADLNSFRAAKQKQSEINSSNAQGKSAKGKSKNKKQKSDASAWQDNCSTGDNVGSDSNEESDGDDSPEDSDVVSTDDESAGSADITKPPEVANETSDRCETERKTEVTTSVSATGSRNEGTETFDASASERSFAVLRNLYNKTGDNESQAYEVWKRLPENERASAYTHVQQLVARNGYRSYLFVYLRDKEWTR